MLRARMLEAFQAAMRHCRCCWVPQRPDLSLFTTPLSHGWWDGQSQDETQDQLARYSVKSLAASKYTLDAKRTPNPKCLLKAQGFSALSQVPSCWHYFVKLWKPVGRTWLLEADHILWVPGHFFSFFLGWLWGRQP